MPMSRFLEYSPTKWAGKRWGEDRRRDGRTLLKGAESPFGPGGPGGPATTSPLTISAMSFWVTPPALSLSPVVPGGQVPNTPFDRTLIAWNGSRESARALAEAMPATSLHEHWVLFLVEGIILILLGLAAVVIPPIATLAVEILYGWLFLIRGIVGLITSFQSSLRSGFWWSLVSATRF